MRITLMVAVAVLCCASSPAQSTKHDQDDSAIARLSYRSGYGVDWRQQNDSPRICFALYRNRDYKIFRVTEDGSKSVHGKLSDDEFVRVVKMLRKLGSETNRGGFILRGSESFIAEIMRADKTVHFVWVDPDHERPFPDSVMKIVNWLQDFAASGASPLTLRELSDDPICPSASEKPIQPAISRLQTPGSCYVQGMR